MNVIVLLNDTFRRDHLGCYGNDWIKTPNFDRLAEQSAVFEKARPRAFEAIFAQPVPVYALLPVNARHAKICSPHHSPHSVSKVSRIIFSQ